MPLVACGAVLTGVMFYFNDRVLPESNHQLQTLMMDIGAKRPTFSLQEQLVNEVRTGSGTAKYFLQAERIDPVTSELTRVIIHDLVDPMRHRTIEAERGTMAFTPEGTDLVITLFEGTIHEVSDRTPGEYQRVAFARQTLAMEGVADMLERRSGRDRRSDREMSIAMLTFEIGCGREELARLRDESYRRSRYAVERALGMASTDPMLEQQELRELGPCDPPGTLQDMEGGDPEGAVPPGEEIDAEALEGQAAPGGAPPPAVSPVPAPPRPSAAAPDAAPATAVPARFATARVQSLYDPMSQSVAGNLRTAALRASTLETRDAQYRVEIHKKYAISMACIIFVLFGAPMALRFARGGVGMAIGVSVMVFAIYWAGLIGGERLADRGRADPFLAMWMPNLVFLVLSVPLVARMGKAMSTGRGGGLLDDLRFRLGSFLGRLRSRRPRAVSGSVGSTS
jgi:lipopolysaccharide export system permease protein